MQLMKIEKWMKSTSLGFIGGMTLLGVSLSPALAQQTFETPEAALEALVKVAEKPEEGDLTRLFGKDAKDIWSSTDPLEDKRRFEDFSAAVKRGVKLLPQGEEAYVIAISHSDWLFPVPIMKNEKGWQYDIEIGRGEIANRIIGANEFSAIAACAIYNQAQKDYHKEDHNEDGVPEYAQKFVSSEGQRDGLYWAADNALERSPLSERIAWAGLGDMDEEISGLQPHNGYVYRILLEQGESAGGGAKSYIENGHMTGGFAMIAYPVEWSKTGIMTFMCGEDGKVYQKNLGDKTLKTVKTIKTYNPDETWLEVKAE